MDLRSLPPELSSIDRVDARRRMIEQELRMDLSVLEIDQVQLGHAEERNCENMFGAVSIPVGLAGPLALERSDGTKSEVYLPLATTEAALVASVNRGCKALRESGAVHATSLHHGATRSIAFMADDGRNAADHLRRTQREWTAAGEATSAHLKILSSDIDVDDNLVFLTIAADTDEAMGMNMVTIAAQAISNWISENIDGLRCVTIAGNVDSDKKPSTRTHDRGRGYQASATITLSSAVIASVLKTTPEAMLETARAKLEVGSTLAGAIGKNLHAANVIAALYLATGQDAAHVVEGSLTDTFVTPTKEGLKVTVRCPALMVGVRGGGTTLPAQRKCLKLLQLSTSTLHPCTQLAESIAAAVLAGEVSLLAAQASHQLAQAHKELARS